MLDMEPENHLAELGSRNQCVETCLKATADRHFVVAHNFDASALTELIQRGYKVIFILRDPRDQVLSMQDWMNEGQWQWLPVSKMKNKDEQLEELITGARYNWRCYNGCIGSRYAIASALPQNSCYITRFEDLVGPEGGGDKDVQLQEIMNIAGFLGLDLPIEKAESVAEESYGDTKTFRHGQIGAWKERFSKKIKQKYKRFYAETLIWLGYEDDYNW
jgi:hypothetical protein